jgi:hypothetical protein
LTASQGEEPFAGGGTADSRRPEPPREAPLVSVNTQRRAVILAVGITMISAAATVMANEFNAQARIFPMSIGAVTTALGGFQVFREYRNLRHARRRSLLEQDAPSTPGEIPAERSSRQRVLSLRQNRSAASAFIWILILGAVMFVFGMTLGIPVFCALFMRIYAKERWRTIAVMAAAISVLNYLIFFELLDGQDFAGLVNFPPEF